MKVGLAYLVFFAFMIVMVVMRSKQDEHFKAEQKMISNLVHCQKIVNQCNQIIAEKE